MTKEVGGIKLGQKSVIYFLHGPYAQLVVDSYSIYS